MGVFESFWRLFFHPPAFEEPEATGVSGVRADVADCDLIEVAAKIDSEDGEGDDGRT